MQITDMNWMMVEKYLKGDDRGVLPLGSTEQHAYLSLCVDNILAERIATEAAAPLRIPVFPVLNYGITPTFRAYPGTVSLRVETYLSVVRDLLDGLAGQGFKRLLIVNGHGGNVPAQGLIGEWMADHPEVRVKFHNWWNAPKVWAQVQEVEPIASHASWMENFPWTRLASVTMPAAQKEMCDLERLRSLSAPSARDFLGDGNFGGFYERGDDVMQRIWEVGVNETRALLETWS